MLYVIGFIIGGLISLILYGKVPVIVSLTISLIVGGIIGGIHYKIRKKKVEREYVKWLQYYENITNSEGES